MPAPTLPRIANGDFDAVEACVDRYGPMVWSLAHGAADAERAAERAFASLWREASRFDPAVEDEPRFVATVARLALGGGPEQPTIETLIAEEHNEPLPPLVRERVLDDAAEIDFKAPPAATPPANETPVAARKGPDWPVLTMLAIGAGLLVSLWLGEARKNTVEGRRQTLLSTQGEAIVRPWTAHDDPAILEPPADSGYGNVVWSDELQEGYLKFDGLSPNDPAVEQYQLWVFDDERDERYPVDGGVFDIADGGPQFVPIDAKLPVAHATRFTVTVERPGGVVVSDRSRTPLSAER